MVNSNLVGRVFMPTAGKMPGIVNLSLMRTLHCTHVQMVLRKLTYTSEGENLLIAQVKHSLVLQLGS